MNQFWMVTAIVEFFIILIAVLSSGEGSQYPRGTVRAAGPGLNAGPPPSSKNR